jgi:3-deoxy-7-phosphoheptulonate synthase
MIVVMRPRCAERDVEHVLGMLDGLGLRHWLVRNPERTVIEVLGTASASDLARLDHAPMVEQVTDAVGPMLAADRRAGAATLEIPLGERATVGGTRIAVIAGPCSVETQGQLVSIAAAVHQRGAVALRGGAFKPRTSPYSFQGLGERGLEMLALAREETGLAVVTEVMSCEQVELVIPYADVLQVGSRNMQNFPLLREVGRQDRPILLKRGWSATLEEFLNAAEYVMSAGNEQVILCERGIRTFERYVRNTLALSVVPELKQRSRLPVIVDPSHGTGRRHLVAPMSRAAIACGADGLLVEVHRAPDEAWCDGDQSLTLDQFDAMMEGLRPIAEACGRGL